MVSSKRAKARVALAHAADAAKRIISLPPNFLGAILTSLQTILLMDYGQTTSDKRNDKFDGLV